MVNLIAHWLLSSLILFGVAYIVPGIAIANFVTALIATFVLSIVNALIKPILSFLTFPINFITLGLFSFILNALMFALAAWLVPGFEVSNFLSALLGSLLMSIVAPILFHILPGRHRNHPA